MDCKNLVIHLNNDTKVAQSGYNLKLKDSWKAAKCKTQENILQIFFTIGIYKLCDFWLSGIK